MENFIKDNWFKLTIVVVILVVAIGIFYWFQLRPIPIRKYCNQWATDKARALKTDYDHYNDYFKWCLQEQGINY